MLHHGDCLDVLPTLAADSIDACVTDPPAGISFMSKDFDTFKGRSHFIAFLSRVMAECRRVARPGAYALVWALPRTAHWTATAIEDAGWVIQDKIYHLFGTGFPKHKSKLKPACEEWILAWKPDRKATPLQIDACRIEGPGWARQDGESGAGFSTDKFMGSVGRGEPTQRNGFRSSSAGRWPANVVLSHIGGPDGCREVGTRRVRGSNGVRGASTHIYGGGNGFTAATGEEVGYADADGTETVPAFACHEDCPVAALDRQSGESTSNAHSSPRKPSPLGQVGGLYRWGDRSDLTWEELPENAREWYERAAGSRAGFTDSGGASRFYQTFACHEDCPVRQLDEQAGERPGAVSNGKKRGNGYGEGYGAMEQAPSYADSGGASRFFYCSKASRADRNEGLEGMPEKSNGEYGDTFSRGRNPVSGERTETRIAPQSNHHPTVKSTDLMRWLCRLVTPEGGTVLDPFMGSGSTGKACALEGFGFVGIERDEEYHRIASARIAAARRDLPLFAPQEP